MQKMRGSISHISLQSPKCPSGDLKGEREQSSRSPFKSRWAEQTGAKRYGHHPAQNYEA